MPEDRGSLFARLFRRLTGPRGGDSREIAGSIRKLAEVQRDQMTTLQARLTALAERVAQQSTSKDANEILHAIRSLTASVQQPLTPDEGEEERHRADAKLHEALDAIAKGPAPIVVGPWTGEVGFELLYWVPFLDWFRTRWRIPSERLVIVSRGGVGSWYGTSGARYTDIFSLMSPALFRERIDPQAHKQREVSPLDREIVDAVSQRHGLDGPAHLHPRLMYRAFAPFWRDESGFGLIERFTSHRRLAQPDAPPAALPPQYIAARFYFSDSFHDTAANRALARAVVEAASAHLPVVVLNPGLDIDEHSDCMPAASDRVIRIGAGVPPEQNLAVQSAVISRASAFVGTYGGYSYLAPFYGVPAIGFYSDRAFKLHHLHVAQRVFERLGGATVLAIDTAHADLVHAVTASVSSLTRRAMP